MVLFVWFCIGLVVVVCGRFVLRSLMMSVFVLSVIVIVFCICWFFVVWLVRCRFLFILLIISVFGLFMFWRLCRL